MGYTDRSTQGGSTKRAAVNFNWCYRESFVEEVPLEVGFRGRVNGQE
jgi:hypothetical protein